MKTPFMSSKEREIPHSMKRKPLIALVLCLIVCAVIIGLRRSEAADKNDTSEDIAAIKQWEHDALAADLKGDFAFYERSLSDDWMDGMSTGEFQTKEILVVGPAGAFRAQSPGRRRCGSRDGRQSREGKGCRR